MIQLVDIGKLPPLEKYEQLAQLTQAVRDLRSEATFLAPRLEERRIWMVSSTVQGGGVAEMLPRLVSLLNELGVNVRWAVINPQHSAFFALTKRLHHLDPRQHGTRAHAGGSGALRHREP